MILLAWAVLGLAIGAVGSEILRATSPRLVQKVEHAAKRVADSVCSSHSDAEQTETKQGSDDTTL